MNQIKVNSIEDYRDVMLWLFDQGCTPCVHNRGEHVTRFHVNRYGNFWEDDESRLKACEKAVNSWIEAGMPKEG